MATIGFIGLGNMGLPMAQNLIKAGHAVQGFDVSKAQADALAASGGQAAASVQAAASGVDTVDEALPMHGEGPSRRQEIVDSAMEMADRLVRTQYDFIRKVVDSAGRTLGGSSDGK